MMSYPNPPTSNLPVLSQTTLSCPNTSQLIQHKQNTEDERIMTQQVLSTENFTPTAPLPMHML